MFSFCASAPVMFGELDDIFLFRGCNARAMRYYIRNTRIMQGIEEYEHAGNPETRLARLPFPLVQPDDVCASQGFHQSNPPIIKKVTVTLPRSATLRGRSPELHQTQCRCKCRESDSHLFSGDFYPRNPAEIWRARVNYPFFLPLCFKCAKVISY